MEEVIGELEDELHEKKGAIRWLREGIFELDGGVRVWADNSFDTRFFGASWRR